MVSIDRKKRIKAFEEINKIFGNKTANNNQLDEAEYLQLEDGNEKKYNQLKDICSELGINYKIDGDMINFSLVYKNEEDGLSRIIKEYWMNIDNATKFLIKEYDLKYCSSCNKYEREVLKCEYCGKEICRKYCSCVEPGKNPPMDCKSGRIEELNMYGVLCSNCYNSITTYKNEEFLNQLSTVDSDCNEERKLIYSWMKECDMYITEPKEFYYSLYRDDGYTEILIEKEKKYGLIIKKIVEYYIENKINPLLKVFDKDILCASILNIKKHKSLLKSEVDSVKSETKESFREILNVSNVEDQSLLGKKYKKEDVLMFLNLITTEELLLEIQKRIIK